MKISIITSTYNRAHTLRDTMRSVLAQSYTDFEHIVVDGASTDDTLAVLREFEPLYKGRLRWISEPDGGIYEGMNKGIAMATGDVVGILNSDDFFSHKDVLMRIAAAMRNDSIDAVYGDVRYVSAVDLHKTLRYYSSRYFRRWHMLLGFQPAHPSYYCRRDVYIRFGNYDTRFPIAADFENAFRVFYRGRLRASYLPMVFVTMRYGGATSNRSLLTHCRIVRDHYRTYAKHNAPLGYLFDFLRYPFKVAEVVRGNANNLFRRSR